MSSANKMIKFKGFEALATVSRAATTQTLSWFIGFFSVDF
jgi:hypothetical protein